MPLRAGTQRADTHRATPQRAAPAGCGLHVSHTCVYRLRLAYVAGLTAPRASGAAPHWKPLPRGSQGEWRSPGRRPRLSLSALRQRGGHRGGGPCGAGSGRRSRACPACAAAARSGPGDPAAGVRAAPGGLGCRGVYGLPGSSAPSATWEQPQYSRAEEGPAPLACAAAPHKDCAPPLPACHTGTVPGHWRVRTGAQGLSLYTPWVHRGSPLQRGRRPVPRGFERAEQRTTPTGRTLGGHEEAVVVLVSRDTNPCLCLVCLGVTRDKQGPDHLEDNLTTWRII